MPTLPQWKPEEDDHWQPLVGPRRARSWKTGSELIDWGQVWSYPDGEAGVKRALLEFTCQAEVKAAAQDIYDCFENWLNRFQQYVTLLTTQNTRWQVKGRVEPSVALMVHNRESLERIQKKNIEPIEVRVDTTGFEALHSSQLREACRLSSSGLPPRLEYRLLLEAYRARRVSDCRKAIIEAATALEICLSDVALRELSRVDISFGKQLLRKYRMLSGKFELVRLLKISLPPKDYTALIINPRNDVMHEGDFATDSLADSVITEVEQLLRLFSPHLNDNS